jgi:hypothetical protein
MMERRIIAAALLMGQFSGPPPQAAAAVPLPAPDCFEQLTKGSGPRIVCAFPVRMTEEELKGVREATRGLLQDASCTMSIDIERKALAEALARPDGTFESSPQPVTCEVKTAKSVLPIKFTFAPRVEFKGGAAVKATPGMANVTGVSRILSWPVKTWVNRSSEIESGMLQVVNAYIKRYGRTASR